jgi:hypothetical protein
VKQTIRIVSHLAVHQTAWPLSQQAIDLFEVRLIVTSTDFLNRLITARPFDSLLDVASLEAETRHSSTAINGATIL